MSLFDHWSEVPDSVWPCRYFTKQEVACRGTGELYVNRDVLLKLDHFRSLLGRPVSLSSAFRSGYHNSKIGGAILSSHTIKGSNGPTAFDIKLNGMDKETIRRVAEQAGFVGFGLSYNSFVHIDNGKKRIW